EALSTTSQRDRTAAELELRLSNALLTLAFNLHYGNDANVPAEWPSPSAWREAAWPELLDACLSDCSAAMRALEPTMEVYLLVQGALQQYRLLQAQGGWPELRAAVDPTSEPSLILGLRARLAMEGYLDDVGTEVWDSTLSDAVHRYRESVQLSPPSHEGVDRLMLAALNTPVDERVAAIEVTLQRLRDSARGTHDRGESVWINVAGFSLEVWDDGDRLFRSRAIVGNTSGGGVNRTPLFADEMERIEVNPVWYPPPRLARNLRLNEATGVVRRNGRLIQLPGPNNPMGQVKFVFPNNHTVFLHHTSNPQLFDRTIRAFSSGCIRMERAIELATLLVSRDQGRGPDEVRAWMDEVLQGSETEVVTLTQPIPVLIEYFTVWVADDGTVEFYGDIYGYDRAARREVLRRRDW
ncbi:MAG: L,D-transpeptidase family protein, partial [Myxococcales bacterium]|nr:L,D-transpeptidase family protein [Myxococcales bacterium]